MNGWVTACRTASRLDRRALLFKDELEKIKTNYRLSFYLCGRLPDVLNRKLSDLIIATNWPTKLLSLYEGADLYTDSEITKKIRFAPLPLVTDRLLFARGPSSDVIGMTSPVYEDVGFSRSLAFVACDAEKKAYLFVFSGSERTIDDSLLAAILLDGVRSLSGLTLAVPHSKPLTGRETDCLAWVAAGKSSDEIATILELSPHTVNDYLQSAIRKLGAANRTQAVVAAMHLGML